MIEKIFFNSKKPAKHLLKIHLVRYEDLVEDPKQSLEMIYNFLNISDEVSVYYKLHCYAKKARVFLSITIKQFSFFELQSQFTLIDFSEL